MIGLFSFIYLFQALGSVRAISFNINKLEFLTVKILAKQEFFRHVRDISRDAKIKYSFHKYKNSSNETAVYFQPTRSVIKKDIVSAFTPFPLARPFHT